MNLSFEDLLLSKEKNRKKKKYFPEYWLSRGYLNDRALFLSKSFYYNTVSEKDILLTKVCTTYNKDFWISRGYTESESIQKVKEIQSNNSKKLFTKYSKQERSKFKPTCIEYYLERGYTEHESYELLASRQKTFSKEICIQKYGKELGEEIFHSRQKRWQNSLKSKPVSELEEINKSKGITLPNYIKKYGLELGTEKYTSWVKEYKERLVRNNMTPYSKESIAWFESFIPKEILDKSKIKDNELFIVDSNKIYFYDFCFNKLIVEYHGHVYHYNYNLPDYDWKSPFGLTKEDSIKKDKRKKQLAEDNGFVYIEYYSNSTEEVENQIKEKILKAIHEENNN